MSFSEELESYCQYVIWEKVTKSVPKQEEFANGRLHRFGKRVWNKSLYALRHLHWGECTDNITKPVAWLQNSFGFSLCPKTRKPLCHAGFIFCCRKLIPFLETSKIWPARYSQKLQVAKLQIHSWTSEKKVPEITACLCLRCWLAPKP